MSQLNSLISRVGDQIDHLKGKKAFSPFAAIPDQIKHIIHRELPFFWILIFWLLFALVSFVGLHYVLSRDRNAAFSQYQNVISVPAEQA